jgi:protein-disulfide isomerase
VIAIAASKSHELLLAHTSAKANEAGWRSLIAGGVPVFGTPAAGFKIVEFSDYQCPFCALADADLSKFVAHHPGDVAVYRRDMPLKIHLYAFTASIAADCAELQGVREPYQSLLFQHQKEFATLDWTALAKQAGITNDRSFAQCVEAKTPSDQIRKDVKIGESMGVNSTPSFLVNGTSLSGGFSPEKLEALYQDTRRKQRGMWHKFLRIH